jgi:hypothetical protein
VPSSEPTSSLIGCARKLAHQTSATPDQHDIGDHAESPAPNSGGAQPGSAPAQETGPLSPAAGFSDSDFPTDYSSLSQHCPTKSFATDAAATPPTEQHAGHAHKSRKSRRRRALAPEVLLQPPLSAHAGTGAGVAGDGGMPTPDLFTGQGHRAQRTPEHLPHQQQAAGPASCEQPGSASVTFPDITGIVVAAMASTSQHAAVDTASPDSVSKHVCVQARTVAGDTCFDDSRVRSAERDARSGMAMPDAHAALLTPGVEVRQRTAPGAPQRGKQLQLAAVTPMSAAALDSNNAPPLVTPLQLTRHSIGQARDNLLFTSPALNAMVDAFSTHWLGAEPDTAGKLPKHRLKLDAAEDGCGRVPRQGLGPQADARGTSQQENAEYQPLLQRTPKPCRTPLGEQIAPDGLTFKPVPQQCACDGEAASMALASGQHASGSLASPGSGMASAHAAKPARAAAAQGSMPPPPPPLPGKVGKALRQNLAVRRVSGSAPRAPCNVATRVTGAVSVSKDGRVDASRPQAEISSLACAGVMQDGGGAARNPGANAQVTSDAKRANPRESLKAIPPNVVPTTVQHFEGAMSGCCVRSGAALHPSIVQQGSAAEAGSSGGVNLAHEGAANSDAEADKVSACAGSAQGRSSAGKHASRCELQSLQRAALEMGAMHETGFDFVGQRRKRPRKPSPPETPRADKKTTARVSAGKKPSQTPAAQTEAGEQRETPLVQATGGEVGSTMLRLLLEENLM